MRRISRKVTFTRDESDVGEHGCGKGNHNECLSCRWLNELGNNLKHCVSEFVEIAGGWARQAF